MKQPPLMYSGCSDWSQWGKIDTDKSGIVNFWNMARARFDNFEKEFDSYKFKKEAIPTNVCESMCYELRNLGVAIHNLGQQLAKIEGFDYDFGKAEIPSWINPDKTIYSHPVKTMKIVKK